MVRSAHAQRNASLVFLKGDALIKTMLPTCPGVFYLRLRGFHLWHIAHNTFRWACALVTENWVKPMPVGGGSEITMNFVYLSVYTTGHSKHKTVRRFYFHLLYFFKFDTRNGEYGYIFHNITINTLNVAGVALFLCCFFCRFMNVISHFVLWICVIIMLIFWI